MSKWSDDYFRVNPDELEERQKADLEPDLDPDTIYDTRDESASIEKYFWGPTAVRLDDDGRMFRSGTVAATASRYISENQRRADHRFLTSTHSSTCYNVLTFFRIIVRQVPGNR